MDSIPRKDERIPFMPLAATSTLKLLPWVLILSVVLRLGSALYQGKQIDFLPGVFDQVSYHELATRLLNGHGFTFGIDWWPATAAGAPTAHWSYLYVLYLTAVYFVFGVSPLAPKIIQAVLAGILLPLLTFRVARRLFGERVGTVAAFLVSVYGYFIYYAGALVTETFYILAILWLLDISTALASDFTSQPKGSRTAASYRPWVRLGVACGLAILLRQVIMFILPIVLLWTLVRVFQREKLLPDFSFGSLLRRGLVTVLIIAGFVLPWTLRNYAAFGQFVLLNTNAGFAFFWGNHPLHKTDFVPIIGGGPEYRALIPAELMGLNEAELDRRLLKRGLRFVADEPSRFLLLSLSRTKEYFKFWPTSKSHPLSNMVRVLSFGVYLPLFICGLITAALRFRSGREQDNPALLLMLLVASAYTGLHLLSWTLVRYRLPVDALMIPFGALGLVFIVDLARKWSPRRNSRKAREQSSIENPAIP
ncbi:MAG: hypothetical protein EHM23_21355 [Acidobacteria bacterium]|nr:MAG: hypothetical protein EHM23_21355 [Acidobacteriota bacterium]